MNTSWELFGIECSKGWAKLYEPIIQKVLAEGGTILQIKEKFGALRIYAGGISDALYDEIQKAEEQSRTICELCGEPGTFYPIGWWTTRCDKCEESGRR